ncbi:MAG TPA: peptidylprolyl isomerase [Kofleriaceae bacterium]|nr:peptidylprolyl isomerase [Kofleriaceae bacterium]
MNRASYLAVLALVAAGCEHKSPRDDHATTGSNTTVAPKPAGNDLPPEPIARDNAKPAPQPLPPPPQDLKPPVPGDLAEYAKDFGGATKLQAAIETSQGTIHCELWGDKAPATVANFIGLATGKKAWMDPKSGAIEQNKPFFDGTQCHRVIAGFMMQCGDPTGSGMGGPGYHFDDEIDRSLEIKPGTLAMANAGVQDGQGTNGSQFFIMEGARPDLVGHHTVFGQCKELEVVKQITHSPTNADDRPNTPVVINKVTISK